MTAPASWRPVQAPSGGAADHGLGQRALALEVVGVHPADQAEVQEADAAVLAEQVVAGMRVAGGAAQVAAGCISRTLAARPDRRIARRVGAFRESGCFIWAV